MKTTGLPIPLQSVCRARSGAAIWLATIVVGASALAAWAAPPVKRARPPKFDKTVSDVFFPDAREKLVGPRPEKRTPGSAIVTPPATPPLAEPRSAAGSTSAWLALISAETLEDEIKSQHRALGDVVQNAVKFEAGDYKRAREHLSLLAVLFAIDAEYGAPVRWQRVAATLRDRLARAGYNCKVGTAAAHSEAQARYDDLTNLIRGGTIDAGSAAADARADKVADRAPLMKRLELAQAERLGPWTANAEEFARREQSIAHEAQVVAALAAVVQRNGYEFADDDAYREYAESMRTQALSLRDASNSFF
jgi:hypothetical protein